MLPAGEPLCLQACRSTEPRPYMAVLGECVVCQHRSVESVRWLATLAERGHRLPLHAALWSC